MLTFLEFIETASRKTITFSPPEVLSLKELAGDGVLEMGDIQEDGSMVVSIKYVLEAAQVLSTPGPLDLVEFAKRGHLTLVLDENLRGLEALEDAGFKVHVFQSGLSDDALKHEASQCAIVTKNSKDFVDDATRFDYDVIAVEDIKFIDTKEDRTNHTVKKMSEAIRRSQLANKRGNFLLRVHDDGHFTLTTLV